MERVLGRVSSRAGPAALIAASLLALGAAETDAAQTLGVAAKPGESPDAKPGQPRKQKVLKATIRRTEYGVPHIRAKDVESLAAGYAYAFASDDMHDRQRVRDRLRRALALLRG